MGRPRIHPLPNQTWRDRLGNWHPSRRQLIGLGLAAASGAVIAGIVASVVLTHRPDGLSPGDREVKQLTKQVGRHYLLPESETPALATVTDTSKLTTPFLKQASNGDKLLIYQKAGIAIIYRPNKDRIVAVGPVSIDSPKKPTGSTNEP